MCKSGLSDDDAASIAELFIIATSIQGKIKMEPNVIPSETEQPGVIGGRQRAERPRSGRRRRKSLLEKTLARHKGKIIGVYYLW